MPAATSVLYNLAVRAVELELIPALRALGVGLIPYSPLHAGLLAGALESGSQDRPGSWSTHLRTLSGHTGPVSAAAFSPDGRMVASGAADARVRLWDPETGQELRTLTGHVGWVHAVTFGPEGHLIASGGEDELVRLWSPSSGRQLQSLTGHEGRISAVAFSPDGRLLASAGTTTRSACGPTLSPQEMGGTDPGLTGCRLNRASSGDGEHHHDALQRRTRNLSQKQRNPTV